MFKLKAPRFGVSRAFGPWRLGTSFGVERQRRKQAPRQQHTHRVEPRYEWRPEPQTLLTGPPAVVSEDYLQAVADVLAQRFVGNTPNPEIERDDCERWVRAVFEAEGRI